jgi:Cu/Ag efflux protein CusF
MKRIALTAALALAAGLPACGEQEATTQPAAPATGSEAGKTGSEMGNMPMASQAKMVKGTGVVTAVDPAAGTIALDHDPMPEAGWPAMTMSFKAAPGVAQAVQVGDKVAFDLRLEGGAGEIIAIGKQ